MVEFKKANIKMASQNASNIVFRKDYTAPDHQIESIDLSFDLIPTCTEVTSKIIAVPQEDRKSDDLILDGDDLTLVSIKIAGEDSFPGQYDMRPGKLIIHQIQSRCRCRCFAGCQTGRCTVGQSRVTEPTDRRL